MRLVANLKDLRIVWRLVLGLQLDPALSLIQGKANWNTTVQLHFFIKHSQRNFNTVHVDIKLILC